VSWCQAPIWGLRPDFISVRHLRVCWCGALSLTRERVCSLQLLLVLASAVILGSGSRGTRDRILLSQIRDSPNLEVQVPVFISPRNRVAQLYPQALGSLYITSYSPKVKVKVTLLLTVSQSLSLGVEPHLGLMTRSLLLCFGILLTYTARTRITENTCHVFAIQPVHWRSDFCLATSYNIPPVRHNFHCCALERVYGAVAW
jgi:hypothetical protein